MVVAGLAGRPVAYCFVLGRHGADRRHRQCRPDLLGVAGRGHKRAVALFVGCRRCNRVGLTVIANAPNPAGFSILKGCFPDGAISPLQLLVSAALPTHLAPSWFILPKSFLVDWFAVVGRSEGRRVGQGG